MNFPSKQQRAHALDAHEMAMANAPGRVAEPLPTASLARCPHFDHLAPFYRWMEMASFGPFLQWCRCAWLQRIAGCRRALVIGDGDGRFTARLLQRNPNVTLDAVDASPAMLAALVRRCGADSHRIATHLADARSWQPAAGRYDLIVTHFFLDCLTGEEMRSLAANIRCVAGYGTLWVVSEFAVPKGVFGRLIAAPLVAFLYLAFGWLTGLRVRGLPDHISALSAAGFVLAQRRKWLGGLLVSEIWSANSGLLDGPKPA